MTSDRDLVRGLLRDLEIALDQSDLVTLFDDLAGG